jgi:hypothetical protein
VRVIWSWTPALAIACSSGGSAAVKDAGRADVGAVDARAKVDAMVARVCASGQQVACACPGGEPSGVQVCAADGQGYGGCTGCAGDDASVVKDSSAFKDSSTAKDVIEVSLDAPAASDAGSWLLSAGTADAGACPGLDPSVDVNQNGVPDCTENLLQNGQFPTNTGTSPWSASVTGESGRATITFSATDEHGFPGSGSAVVVNTVAATTANGGSVASECVPIHAGGTFGAYTRYLVASGQPGGDANAAAWITIDGYLDDACTMSYEGISGGTLGTTKDVWSTYVRQFTPDPSVQGIRIELYVLKGATTSDVQATFDNVLLVQQ